MRPIDTAVALRVYEALGTGNKTRNALASELSLPPATVKTVLARMLTSGMVTVAQSVATGKRGRPAFLYQQVPPPVLAASIESA